MNPIENSKNSDSKGGKRSLAAPAHKLSESSSISTPAGVNIESSSISTPAGVNLESSFFLQQQFHQMTLMQSFSKPQLVEILTGAATDNRRTPLHSMILSIVDDNPSYRRIFINNLGPKTTRGSLLKFFSDNYGEVEDADVVRDWATGSLYNGYGFVTFKKGEALLRALQNPSKKIEDGFISFACLWVKQYGYDRNITKADNKRDFITDESNRRDRKIRVEIVPEDTCFETLLSYFEKFGEIEEGPGMGKGNFKVFAYITYKDVESAKAVRQKFPGRINFQTIIHGNLPKPDDDDRLGKSTGGNLEIVRNIEELQEKQIVHNILQSFTRPQLVDILQRAAGEHLSVKKTILSVIDENPSNHQIFIKNLGPRTTSERLLKFFSDNYGGEVEDAEVIFDGAGTSKGFGFVTFKKEDALLRALQNPSKKIDGFVTSARICRVAKADYNTSFRTDELNKMKKREIVVENVPENMSPETLLKVFEKYGQIEEGPSGFDMGTGKSKGFAYILYKNVESAKAACAARQHKIYDDVTLVCRMARKEKKKSDCRNFPVDSDPGPGEKTEYWPPPDSYPVEEETVYRLPLPPPLPAMVRPVPVLPLPPSPAVHGNYYHYPNNVYNSPPPVLLLPPPPSVHGNYYHYPNNVYNSTPPVLPLPPPRAVHAYYYYYPNNVHNSPHGGLVPYNYNQNVYQNQLLTGPAAATNGQFGPGGNQGPPPSTISGASSADCGASSSSGNLQKE